MLTVPFYDSFLHLNNLESHKHIPDFTFTKPIFFKETNDIPFDDILLEKVEDYCAKNNFETLDTQSVYYNKPEDFPAYLTFRCIHARGSAKKSTCERPELSHLCSDTFNFEKLIK